MLNFCTTLWIARDKDKTLWVYDNEPIKEINSFSCSDDVTECYQLDDKMYPELTFENSPQRLIIKQD